MIRLATKDDIPRLVELGVEFHALAKATIPYDPPTFGAMLGGLLDNPACVIFVSERDGVVVGSIGGILAPVLFNLTVTNVSEVFWFVAAAYRGRSDGQRLIDALEAWAKERKAATITMIALAAHPIIGDLYEARGYTPQETQYVKEL